MKYNLIILLSLFCFTMAEAQDNTNKTAATFKLEVNIPTQGGKQLYFGQYYKEATYALDSVMLSGDGKATITKNENPGQGQYFLYVEPSFQLDFLIGENQNNIRFYIDEEDFSKSTVSGSHDTQLLWEYLDETVKMDTEIDEEKEQLINAGKEKSAELNKLETKKLNFIKSTIKTNTDNWFGVFVKALENPIDYPHIDIKSEKEYKANREYVKAHYFDNIDLTDARFWKTNFFVSHINTYMKQWVDQIPDSLAAAASRIVARTKGNDYCFEQMLSKFVNQAMESVVMGDENIWAKLYEDYILEKKVPWIEESQYLKMGQMYAYIKNNRIGQKAYNLTLATVKGDTIKTNELKSDFTILYFFNPDCSSCQVQLPKLKDEVYAKYKDKGVEVITINIGKGKEDWIKYLEDGGFTDWINCEDFNYKSEYWMHYDTSGVPSVFVLDKNKTIVAKKVNVENLKRYLDYQYSE